MWGLKNVKHSTRSLRDQFRPGDTNVTYQQTQAAVQANPIQLLHDGRASSLSEAILWHGGESQASADAYRNLSQANKQLVLKFLESL